MSGGESTAHILQSLAVNVVIAIVKAGAAIFTGSGAMLAEAIHSFADCGNQILLLVGVKQAKRPPSPTFPLGQGRELYFWSFLVALMLFTGGGVFSTRSLSRDPATKSIPVVMVTTKGQETDRIWGMRQGAVDYLVKPVDASDLVAKANEVLHGTAGA